MPVKSACGKCIPFFCALIATVFAGSSYGEPMVKEAVSSGFSRYSGETVADTLVLVSEGTPDTLALVRRTNGDGAGDLLETSFGDLQRIEVYLSDNSPDDIEGGGALFAFELLIYDLEGNETRATEIGFEPFIQGGFNRRRHLAADGFEEIYLLFDLGDESYIGPEPSEMERLVIELTVANDYHIEVFLKGILEGNASALGNIKDLSNRAVVRIEIVKKARGHGTFIEATSWAQIKNE